jgi:IS5 family transposase
MKPRERRDSGQGDLLRSRLDAILDMDHQLVALARKVDYEAARDRRRISAPGLRRAFLNLRLPTPSQAARSPRRGQLAAVKIGFNQPGSEGRSDG